MTWLCEARNNLSFYLLDTFSKPSCQVCGVKLKGVSKSFAREMLCGECEKKSHFLKIDPLTAIRCKVCLEFTFWGSEFCGICEKRDLPFIKLYSIWRYFSVSEALIKSFKYGKNKSLADFFSWELCSFMEKNLRGDLGKHFDILLPVPSPLSHLRLRGFSHMHLLARCFSRASLLPHKEGALCAKPLRDSQAALSLQGRIKNARNTYYLGSDAVNNMRVLLLDDVITSGSSALVCSRLLKEAGARSVSVISLARTPSFSQNFSKAVVKLQ